MDNRRVCTILSFLIAVALIQSSLIGCGASTDEKESAHTSKEETIENMDGNANSAGTDNEAEEA